MELTCPPDQKGTCPPPSLSSCECGWSSPAETEHVAPAPLHFLLSWPRVRKEERIVALCASLQQVLTHPLKRLTLSAIMFRKASNTLSATAITHCIIPETKRFPWIRHSHSSVELKDSRDPSTSASQVTRNTGSQRHVCFWMILDLQPSAETAVPCPLHWFSCILTSAIQSGWIWMNTDKTAT